MRSGIDRLLVELGTTLKAALEQLEETEEKTLFVMAAGKKLVGTLTDGDVRRWILTNGSLEGAVEDVCNKEPKFVNEGYDLNAVKILMLEHNILCIPVLGPEREIIELLAWEDVFGDKVPQPRKSKLDIPIVIMAGGAGSRLDPFTRVFPKALVPIGDKTIIEHIMDSFVEYGVDAFYLSVFNKSRIIKAYFEELSASYRVHYLEESKPLGTAGGLRQLVGRVAGPVLVTNCDVLIKADYAELVQFHRESQNRITLITSVRSYPIPYGICEINSRGELTAIKEKPEYKFLVNTGVYVVDEDALKLIPEEEEFHVTDLIRRIMETDGRAGVFPVGEKSWSDVGEWTEYRKTLSYLMLED